VKECPYHDPEIIARYFDGALDPGAEEEFSKHLFMCPRCMEALVELERDSALMHGVPLKPLPDSLSRSAVFRLEKTGLRLLKNLFGSEGFTPVLEPAPVRGKGACTAQRYEKEEVTVDILPGQRDCFSILVDGVRGRTLTLRKGDRIVEKRTGGDEDSLRMDGLGKGEFSLLIDEEGFISFIIC
jgi:hypothetical protein